MCDLKRHGVLPFSMTYMRTDSVNSFNLDLQMFDDLESLLFDDLELQLSWTNPVYYHSIVTTVQIIPRTLVCCSIHLY